MEVKFEFTLDFQLDLIRFTLKDKRGAKVLRLYTDGNFIENYHAIIVKCLHQYYKRKKKIPSETFMKEEVSEWFKTRESEDITEDDKKAIYGLLKEIYDKPVTDGDEIYERCARFASYLKVKEEIDNLDLFNFKDYEPFANKVLKAIRIGKELKEEKGTYLIQDISTRQLDRQDSNPIIPTPFRQINKITNAGGYDKGSIIVVLDKPKQLKTAMMINVARGYLRMKKKVAYFDMENGQDNISMRLEQSLTNISKHDLLSGEHDKKVQKVLRKYRRLGGEAFIKRIPSGSSTALIRNILSEEYRETGFMPDVLILDYLGLLGSISGKEDDHSRISDAYLDIANLGLDLGVEHIWTPHHVKNEAFKRENSRYEGNDFAKCIEIGRHVQAVFGLNRNETERESGVVRMELVMQRDGIQEGRALFWAENLKSQRLIEFSKVERDGYDEQWKKDDNKKVNKPSSDL